MGMAYREEREYDKEYPIGAVYTVTRINDTGRWHTGDVIRVTGVNKYGNDCIPCKLLGRETGTKPRRPSTIAVNWYRLKREFNEEPTKELSMNATIAKLFNKTAEAVLVEKHLGVIIKGDQVEFIKLDGKQKELLAVANELEAKANKHVA